jgi:hypothetical protein
MKLTPGLPGKRATARQVPKEEVLVREMLMVKWP